MRRRSLTAPLALALAAAGASGGCASIVSKGNWPVTVTSDPPGVPVVIRTLKGEDVHAGVTPFTLTLRSRRGYMQPAHYVIDAQGAVTDLRAELNPWYVGNLVFGGIPGFLLVDPLTGAMWKMPERVRVRVGDAVHDLPPIERPREP